MTDAVRCDKELAKHYSRVYHEKDLMYNKLRNMLVHNGRSWQCWNVINIKRYLSWGKKKLLWRLCVKSNDILQELQRWWFLQELFVFLNHTSNWTCNLTQILHPPEQANCPFKRQYWCYEASKLCQDASIPSTCEISDTKMVE